MAAEFFVCREFALFHDALGQPCSATRWVEPTSATKKDGWTCYAILARFHKTARAEGHRGIVSEAYILDGGLFEYQARRQRQRHSLWHQCLEDRDLAELLELQMWPLAALCKAHVCHNACRWGCVWLLVDEKADLSMVHISMNSVRNSWAMVLSHLECLIATVEFVRRPLSRDIVFQWWTCLGYKPALVELLVDLDPEWDVRRQRLLISETCRDRENITHLVTKAVLGVYVKGDINKRFVDFGTSMRPLCGSIFLGLDYVVSCIQHDHDADHTHINGWSQMVPRIRRSSSKQT